MMKEDRQNVAKNNFFTKLIGLYNANPSKFNSVIKSDSNLDLQFYYDESKKSVSYTHLTLPTIYSV